MNKLVIDLGGSMMKCAILDMDGNILDRKEVVTPLDTLNHLLDEIVKLYEIYYEDIDGIAISMPGNIDSDTGQIYAPGALLYNQNVNIIEAIHTRIDLPVAVENDGKSAALAELWKGNLKDCKDGIVFVIGTGIGGGIIHNRKLVKGNHFFAGEFSYLMADGQANGMESAFALQGSTASLIQRVASIKQLDPTSIDGKKIFQWIHDGDEQCKKALDDMATSIAIQLYNLQCILDPEKVCIGGGISKQEILLVKIREKLAEIYQRIPFPIPHPTVETCAFFNDSNLIGALYNYKIHFGG